MQTILDKFKKREKKGDSRSAVADLEARLAEVAEQLAAAADSKPDVKPDVTSDVSGAHVISIDAGRPQECLPALTLTGGRPHPLMTVTTRGW